MERPGPRLRTACLALLAGALPLLLPSSAPAQEPDPNLGPGLLTLRSQAPSQIVRLDFPHLYPGAIPPGDTLTLGSTRANFWVNDPSLKMDFETVDRQVHYSHGFPTGWGISLSLDARRFQGGYLDSLVQGFHDLMDMGQNGRDQVPKGRTYATVLTPEGTPLFETGDLNPFNHQGVTLMAERTVVEGTSGRATLSLSGGGRVLFDFPALGTGDRFAWNLGAGAARRLGEGLFGVLHLDYTRSRPVTLVGTRFRAEEISLLTGVTWKAWESTHLVAQYFFCQGGMESPTGPLGKPSSELSLGLKHIFSPRSSLEVGLIENLFIFDNSPDLGLHLAYCQRL